MDWNTLGVEIVGWGPAPPKHGSVELWGRAPPYAQPRRGETEVARGREPLAAPARYANREIGVPGPLAAMRTVQ
jgi:hypothetical protein